MHRKSIFLFIMGILVIASVPVTLSLVKKNQSLRQEASTSNAAKDVKVLVLEYYPRDPANNSRLDLAETGINTSVQEKENYVNISITNHLAFMRDATKFRGYNNSIPLSYLNYEIYERKKFYEKIPRGYQLWWTTAKRPHYGQIMNNINICDYVNNHGVSDVWMFGYHSSIIEPDESRMASKHGDISNSLPKESASDYAQYKMPICNKAYTLYNFNYDRGNESMAHNLIHHIENVIPFTENKWPPSSSTIQGSTFWGDFSEYIQSSTIHNYKSSCGNAHYAPNWSSPSDSYRYDLTNSKESNCTTWHPDESKTTFQNVSCSTWGCTELGFYKWFLQSIPGYNSCIQHNGKYMRNWWDAIHDFDAFIDQGRSLYQDQPNCTSAPPTATPTSTPENEYSCDFDGRNGPDIFDYTIWLGEFRSGQKDKADCDVNNSVDIFDYAKWLTEFRLHNT